jgi:hypothetical protein
MNMKKILTALLVIATLFTFVGCGNNDENNAAVQAKMDEAEALVQEICDWYEDNGLLEGEYEAEFRPQVDQLLSTMEETKGYNQQIIDRGGYSDEETRTMLESLDSDIAIYKKALEAGE